MTLNYTVYMSRLAFIMMALLMSELAFSSDELVAPPAPVPPTPTAGATGALANLQLRVPISYGPAPEDLEFPPYGLRKMRQHKRQLLCWLNRARGRLSGDNKAKRVCQQTCDDATSSSN